MIDSMDLFASILDNIEIKYGKLVLNTINTNAGTLA